MHSSAFQINKWVKKIPGVLTILRWRYELKQKILRIRELNKLLYEDHYVIFSLTAMMKNEVPLIHKMIIDEVREWLELYGSIRLRRKTRISLGAPPGSILLFTPQALLKIPISYEEYLSNLKHQSRYLIRKAENLGFEYREFSWNEHLDEIYEVNTSKEVRQGEPMRGWYSKPVQPRYWSPQESKCIRNYGAFKDNRLRAYIHLLILGNFAFPKHIIGHAEYLNDGIMNGLVSYVVKECIRKPEIQWIEYGRFIEGSSLDAFKKHIGFNKYAIIFELSDQKELLNLAKSNIKSIWLL